MKDKRIYIDYIKAIGMIFVILGHINFANEPIKEWIYSFHMPLFFFASGLVLKDVRLSKAYFIKKVKTLVVPYLLWALMYAEFSLTNIAKIGYASYSLIIEAGSLSSLWFLPVLFISLFIVQILLKIIKSDYALLVVGIVLFITATFVPNIKCGYPWGSDVALIAVLFIIIGNIYEKFMRETSSIGLYCAIMSIGLILTFCFSFNLIKVDSYVLMAGKKVGDPLLFLSSAIGGCAMVYGLARLIERKWRNSKVLSFIGKNTLVIFAVQKPIIIIFEKVFYNIGTIWVIELIVTLTGTLLISCVVVRIINEFAPCLNGRIK